MVISLIRAVRLLVAPKAAFTVPPQRRGAMMRNPFAALRSTDWFGGDLL
jgi:hypothetical protein